MHFPIGNEARRCIHIGIDIGSRTGRAQHVVGCDARYFGFGEIDKTSEPDTNRVVWLATKQPLGAPVGYKRIDVLNLEQQSVVASRHRLLGGGLEQFAFLARPQVDGCRIDTIDHGPVLRRVEHAVSGHAGLTGAREITIDGDAALIGR